MKTYAKPNMEIIGIGADIIMSSPLKDNIFNDDGGWGIGTLGSGN